MALVVYQGPPNNINNDSIGDRSDSTAEGAKATKVTRFSSSSFQYRSNNNSSTIDRSEDFVGLVIYINMYTNTIVIIAFSLIYTLLFIITYYDANDLHL